MRASKLSAVADEDSGPSLLNRITFSLGRVRNGLVLAASIVAPLVVSAVLVPFRRSFAATTAALVLVAVVVAVAVGGSRIAGWIAAASSSLWFDFFLTPPYQRLAIAQRADVETAISLFVIGVVVTELAVRNRMHRNRALEESDHVGALFLLSELVADGVATEHVIERTKAELIELLNLRACFFEADPSDHLVTRIDHDGNVYVGNLEWGAGEMGLPGSEVELLVYNQGRGVGRFLLVPTPGWPVSAQQRIVAVAMVDQVGASLAQKRRLA